MGTVTATVIAGTGHPNHGGISPSGTLTLWENAQPTWRFEHHGDDARPVTWVPFRPETVFADALLLLASVEIEDLDVVRLLEGACGDRWTAEHVDLSEVLGTEPEELRSAVHRAIDMTKLVITVLPESSINGQLDLLETVACDVELCLPTYWRRSTQWSPETEAGGHLPS